MLGCLKNEDKMSEKETKPTYPLKQASQAVGATIIIIVTVAIWLHNQSIEGYKSTLESKDATIENYGERLISKDEQLNEFRKRLGIIEKDQTSFTILTNKELKEKALKIVAGIRELLNQYRLKSDEITYARNPKNWDESNFKSSKLSTELMNDYKNNFKMDALLLRDEILSRLSKKTKKNRNKYAHDSYERTVNMLGIEDIVDDLERITKLLIE